MACKFYIGQKVVAIVDHSQGVFKKGDEFVVLEIAKICTEWCIKIHDSNFPNLTFCKHNSPFLTKGTFFVQKCFAPVQESGVSEMTFEDVMDLMKPKKELIT